ncbi:hypothetical protein ACLBW0_23960 [Enterobacteriaceae bacterium C34A]
MAKFTTFMVSVFFSICVFSSPLFANESVVTSIRDELCLKTDEDKYTGATVHQCKGIAGYHLSVLYDDNRMSLDVISPDNVKYSLELWSKVTTSFSVLANNIEWRVLDGKDSQKPIALILKMLTASAGINNKSWWVIAKISKSDICITDILDGSNTDIITVRKLADSSLSKSCLEQ